MTAPQAVSTFLHRRPRPVAWPTTEILEWWAPPIVDPKLATPLGAGPWPAGSTLPLTPPNSSSTSASLHAQGKLLDQPGGNMVRSHHTAGDPPRAVSSRFDNSYGISRTRVWMSPRPKTAWLAGGTSRARTSNRTFCRRPTAHLADDPRAMVGVPP